MLSLSIHKTPTLTVLIYKIVMHVEHVNVCYVANFDTTKHSYIEREGGGGRVI